MIAVLLTLAASRCRRRSRSPRCGGGSPRCHGIAIFFFVATLAFPHGALSAAQSVDDAASYAVLPKTEGLIPVLRPPST